MAEEAPLARAAANLVLILALATRFTLGRSLGGLGDAKTEVTGSAKSISIGW